MYSTLGNLFHFLLRQFSFYFRQYHLCPHHICVSLYVCVLILAALCCLSALSRSVRLAVGVERAPQSTPYRASSGIVCVGRTTDTGTQSISLMKCNNCQVYLVTHSRQGLSHRLSLSGGLALMNRKSFCVCVAFGLLPGSTFSKSDQNLFLCGIRMGKQRGRWRGVSTSMNFGLELNWMAKIRKINLGCCVTRQRY